MTEQTLQIQIKFDARQGIAASGRQTKAIANLSQQVEVAQVSMKRLSVAVAAGGAALAGLGLSLKAVFVDLPRALLAGALAAERLENGFRALEGSLEAGRAQIAFVRAEAQRLGIPLAEAGAAWLKLAAAARGTALEGDGARKVFSAVAGASSTLGLSADETSGALLAISQMMSKGTVQAEELRGQLGERIPGAFQIAARAMGVTTAELSNMLDRGELIAADFLPKFAAQLARELPGAADSTQAAINRLGNAAEEWRQTTGAALAVAIDGMHGLKAASTGLGRDNHVVEWARRSAKAIAILIDVVRELVLFVPNVLATIGGSIAAVARDIKFAFDLAAAVMTEGVGTQGRAAMKRALDERNAFVAAYNEDMARRWFPRQLSTRVDAFFADLGKQQAAAARKAGVFIEGELSKQQQATIAALKSKDEKLAAQYRAHAQNLYDALISGAIGIDEYNRHRARLEAWHRGERPARQVRQVRAPPVAAFDAELAALQAHLKTTEGVLETAFRARLIDEETYHRAKAEAQRRAIDLEERELRGRLADQPEQLRVALEALAGKRYVVDFELRTNLDRARQDFADFKAGLERDIAQATGTETPEMRRAAIAAGYRDMLARMGDDAAAAALVQRAIDAKAAQGELQALEAAWRLALETMRNAQQAIAIQQQQGLLTTADAQRQIAAANAQASAEMDILLPKLEAAANALGPEAAARVAAFRNELAVTQAVVDPFAATLNTAITQGFEDMFLAIGQGAKTAKEAFADFARSVLAAIQRILAQRLAEQLFGGRGAGGIGGGIAGFLGLLRMATGGKVPGTGSGDTVPALLTPGEFVIRKDAVRRFGTGFLAAINGLRLPPAAAGGRLAFAAGGLVPAVAGAAPSGGQNIRIVNAIDPGVTHDHLQSPAGERVIVNIIGRNARAIRSALQG